MRGGRGRRFGRRAAMWTSLAAEEREAHAAPCEGCWRGGFYPAAGPVVTDRRAPGLGVAEAGSRAWWRCLRKHGARSECPRGEMG